MREEPYRAALRHDVLTKQQEHELLSQYAALRAAHGAEDPRAIKARNRVVSSFLRLVAHHAHRRKRLPFEDLMSEGVKGLIIAVERFEVERGLRFATYASWWVKHKLNRAIQDHATTVRIPVHLQDKRGHGERELDGVKLDFRVSLDAPLSEEGLELHELLAAEPEEGDAPEQLQDQRAAEELRRIVLQVLDPREREIIESRYLRGNDETLAEVGQRIGALQEHRVGRRPSRAGGGISRERVRQIEADSLKKLRQALELLWMEDEEL